MFKKLCSVVLSALLLQAAAVPAFAATSAEKEAKRAEKVRTQFAKLGTGKDVLVRVELRDKTKVEGYLSEAGADSFTVTDRGGKTTTIPYRQVRKAQGNNFSTGAKIAVGAFIGAAAVLAILYAMWASHEP